MSAVDGFKPEHILDIRNKVSKFDLTPINRYLSSAVKHNHSTMDLFVGVVDSVTENNIFGWAINLSNPAEKVELILVVDSKIVSSATTGISRPDVASAGYASQYTGFVMKLPNPTPKSFDVILVKTGLKLDRYQWKNDWHPTK
ncbi:hypothetical protein [Polynucleobacter sp. UK-Mo-2m-Kol15]|uniref:hypothetical protein n=1 Tax=Polynucleobacter sp. UK-Mo-2m-Kol15 TaxID=2576916 RepID=UPI001C0C6BCF|nr:hypothetical protein [Polynucleobacter sp. UK-Mo-2m-Kol15]MBU3574771.1 hypothetical protein [Polynucleobacter sp. UK-Mo-2m-Kol15]